jgi:amino acid permease
VFPILKELHNPTVKRMTIATTTGVVIYTLLYLSCGVFGYLTFYGTSQDNILKNYKKDNIAAMIGKVGIAITAMMSFPLQLFSCRNTINLIIFPNSDFSWIRHIIIALIITVITFVTGTLVPFISVVFGLMGSSFTSI